MAEYLSKIPKFREVDKYGGVVINREHNYEGIGHNSGSTKFMYNVNRNIIYPKESVQLQ